MSANTSARTGKLGFVLMTSLCVPFAVADAQEEARAAIIAQQLEEIVVSARKRTEGMQDVPIAISAVNAASLERMLSPDLSDIGRSVPNVVLDPAPGYANATAFAIRGVSFQDPDATFEPAVGVVLDGVFLGKANANLLDLYDVEQIEVLRGPQGTLFGKNTIGGLVNVRSRRPSGETHAHAQVTAGNYGRLDFRGSVEFPLAGEKLAVKVAGLKKRADGFFRNELDGRRLGAEDAMSGRLSLVYKPTDSFDLTFIADTIRDQGHAAPQRNASPPGFIASQLGYPAITDPDLFRTRINGANTIDSRTSGAMLEANWRLASHTITSITGFRDTDDRSDVDLDGDRITLLHYPRRQLIQQFSEELRVASTWSDTFDYVAGVMYMRQWHDQRQTQLADCALIGACPGVPAGLVPVPLDAVQRQVGKAYAAFAQANYRLTPKLRLTFGGRYSSEDKDFSLFPPGYNLAPPGFAPYVATEASFSDFTPKLGVDFEASDHIMLYASFSSGFKAGGFNGRSNTITGIGPYQPEQVEAFEVGLKSEWFGRRLRANVATFYNDYTDMQVEVIVASTAGPGQETLVRNVGTAETSGIEVELTALPVDGLAITASAGYLHAKYTKFFADLTGQGVATDNTQLELRRAPEWTSALGVTYEVPLGNAGTLTFASNANYTSRYHTDVLNDAFAVRPSATLVGASIAFESADGRYRVALFGENLTDRRFINNGIAAGNLFAFQEPNRPRVYGAEFSLHY